ncbi:hypothetical protein GLOIN_2v1788249 [Rhizophagus irregularis DAOM 181602=DAOM 197198]|uniref:Uncharacterized protein n=1 Tax=Rhizophagus irregularis (strain DAOM 181602 / DAOM 197198 / MUCL 43194) TaxID=747089 RepID=A0A2P4P475_RHIID|nr:hypothetical protein GLOIN_2v1788249 [Rhizophagus irregularis DAOM 181602=DAOM 197198]POG60180.1 hypothetical protein GLOIN_2v1788249 [Rhizophagus irregularis DAOM 181602=DAOM 197198]|eukprot:XP_025167046.1 hypothetical protein GLOIN_2v1788249 [Rhizophagus irregularis DAOM 181602=DAOM 197198]
MQRISKIRRPEIIANFIYKVVELATYTSAFATDAINILTGNTLNTGHSTRQNYGYNDIDYNDENVYDHKKKDVSTWGENPSSTTTTFATTNTTPTESSQTSPSQQNYPTTKTETKPSLIISTSPSQQDYPTTQTSQKIVSTPTHLPTNSTSRRRQFHVRHGPEAEAALNSKVEVTVEMILVEEKEREEQIMKEFGIQTPISRRARDALGPNAHNKPGNIPWRGLQENYHKYSSRKFFHDLRSQQNKIEMLERIISVKDDEIKKYKEMIINLKIVKGS